MNDPTFIGRQTLTMALRDVEIFARLDTLRQFVKCATHDINALEAELINNQEIFKESRKAVTEALSHSIYVENKSSEEYKEPKV